VLLQHREFKPLPISVGAKAYLFMKRIVYSLVAGCIFGFLPPLVDAYTAHGAVPLWLLNSAGTLSLPGNLVSILAGGNVHGPSYWVSAWLNFAFYFGLAYGCQALWHYLRLKSHTTAGRENPNLPG
jgi:membrane-bound metal-dependent hydrolase YbcI (DUF457 family)